MADITSFLTAIMEAKYGEEVRESIRDSLLYMQNDITGLLGREELYNMDKAAFDRAREKAIASIPPDYTSGVSAMYGLVRSLYSFEDLSYGSGATAGLTFTDSEIVDTDNDIYSRTCDITVVNSGNDVPALSRVQVPVSGAMENCECKIKDLFTNQYIATFDIGSAVDYHLPYERVSGNYHIYLTKSYETQADEEADTNFAATVKDYVTVSVSKTLNAGVNRLVVGDALSVGDGVEFELGLCSLDMSNISELDGNSTILYFELPIRSEYLLNGGLGNHFKFYVESSVNFESDSILFTYNTTKANDLIYTFSLHHLTLSDVLTNELYDASELAIGYF